MNLEEASKTPRPLTKKKSKGGSNIKDRDAYERLNFLLHAGYQAAKEPRSWDLSKFYMRTFNEIRKKSVIRISPTVKKSFCKQCLCYWLPAVSCTMRIEKDKGCAAPRISWTCKSCGYKKSQLLAAKTKKSSS